MEYAIVDIETTGGYASGAGITEVAVLIHDGQKVIQSFEALIDPLQYIPLPIQMLTGISNDMVEGKPTFADIADELFTLLNNRTFVEHNVNFDYSFLKHHFLKAGYQFSATKLCTVRMSRKIKPGLPSYSLSKLCASLNIPLYNNHRAGGDAAATAILFGHLLKWDTEGVINGMLKKNSKEQLLPPNLPKEDFEALPSTAGVYYFRNKEGKVVYVGKANDLRKRVLSHFTGHNVLPQRQNFIRDIHSITFERCGTELMAFLLEAVEIARLWPIHNRAMKRRTVNYGMYAYEDLNGYLRLVVGKQGKNQLALHEFTTELEARNLLRKLVKHFNLCPELCGIMQCDHANVIDPAGWDETYACSVSEGADAYNEKVHQALATIENYLPSFLIKDKGRNEHEQSCIWVEKGKFYGMGYIDAYADISSMEDIKSMLTPYQMNHYMLQLVYNYAEKNPAKTYKLQHLSPAQDNNF